MTLCVECARPWGVLLDRGEEPSDERAVLARVELVEVLREQWECDYEPDELAPVDWDALPPVRSTLVVFISESLCKFADEATGYCDVPEPDCWYELDHVDFPQWLLKRRKKRWAYLWPCCDLGSPEHYVAAAAVPSMEGEPQDG